MFLNVTKTYSISAYMFWPHLAIFRQHVLMEPTARCSLMSYSET
jgi:hypothetical protein